MGNLPCLASDADNIASRGTTKNVLHVDDLHPVYGRLGSTRHVTFIAGEQLHFSAKMSGISVTSDGHCDYNYEYSLANPSGKAVEGCSGLGHMKEVLCLGGDISTVYLSINTEMSTAPGQYTLKVVALDNLSKQTATRELTVNILDSATFGISNASLYRDRECLHGSSGNFTLGEGIHVGCDIRIPKNKNNEVATDVYATVFDSNNNIICELISERKSDSNIGGAGILYGLRLHCTIAETGAYRVHVEARNVDTNEIKKCDLPLVVIASPNTPVRGVNPTSSESQGAVSAGALIAKKNTNALSIDAYPTLGCLGSPRDAIFISGEKALFFMMLEGLSVIEDQRANCDVGLSVRDSYSVVRINGAEEMKRLLVSVNGSFTSVFRCQLTSGMEPGHYMARFVVRDNVTNRAAIKNVAITIVDNDTFALGDLDLSNDQEGKSPAGPNLTIGDTIYTQCGIYLPKKSNGHDVEVSATFLDANRKEITTKETYRIKNVASVAYYPRSSTKPVCTQPFVPNRPGSYFVRLNLKDTTTLETVTKEMPFNVFSPPVLDQRVLTTDAKEKQTPQGRTKGSENKGENKAAIGKKAKR